MQKPAETIEDMALRWVARLDREEQTASQHPELQLWLAEDDRHRGAFMRAMAAWQQLEKASILSRAETVALPLEAAPLPIHSGETRQGLPRRWLIAGAVCAASVVGLFGVQYFQGRSDRFSTARGEIRRVPLSDGSLMAINTSTEVTVGLAKDLRAVTILEGEAWIQVAPDAARPFVVSTGDIRVRAVGTAFSVRKLEHGSEVLVTEGVVEVWSSHSPSNVQRLHAGQSLIISSESLRPPTQATHDEVQRKLAWREGEIVLAGESLSSAIAEFNRYNDIQIVLIDTSLSNTEWIGRFRTNEPQAFAQAVAITTGSSVQIGPDTISIGRASG